MAERKYPWDSWCDGRKRTLKQGRDFDCKVESMISGAMGAARRRGLTVAVERFEDRITMRTRIGRPDPWRRQVLRDLPDDVRTSFTPEPESHVIDRRSDA